MNICYHYKITNDKFLHDLKAVKTALIFHKKN